MQERQAQSPLPICLQGRSWLLPPTPPLLTLHTWSGQDVEVIRDDLLDPIASGNKLRKLDAIWPTLRQDKPKTIVTCGGVHSAYCAAIAALAARDGISAHLLMRGQLPQPRTGYAALSELFGQVHAIDYDTYADRDAMLERFASRLEGWPDQVTILPEGARSLEALLGFIRLAHALATHAQNPATPTRVILDSATGTTALGMALGLQLCGLNSWEVHAIELVAHDHERTLAAIKALHLELCARWSLPHRPLPLRWFERATPRRFGKVFEQDLERCAKLARATGILCDPIYTIACWEHLEHHAARAQQRTMILHTGGALNILGAAARWPAHWERACAQ